MAHLLITGGAGFIGSHACLTLLEAGHSLVVVDNFEGSSAEPLQQVAALAGLGPLERLSAAHWGTADEPRRLLVLQGDIRSSGDLDRAFKASSTAVVEAVLHFAGLKAVAESVAEPLHYWDTNVAGSRCLLQAMARHNCRTLVFSSSATLYGLPDSVPITESAPVRPINPYGHTKAAVEQMLADLAASQAGWRLARLRYFNPVGAHPSGRIGEAPPRAAQQPLSPDQPGGPRAKTVLEGLWQGLAHGRWHRSQGLHPCHGSGRRPPGGCAQTAQHPPPTPHPESGEWPGPFGARIGAGL